ncbi:MAG: hypothetical protein RKH07_00980 [Gammaproteobacteria bacterium]
MIRAIAFYSLTTFALVACEQDGPAERFGENVDEAASQARDAAGNAADNIEDAATDAGNAVEDACEDVTDRNC